MKAVVMAGGEGTRLRPLTSGRPKPLVPIANKPVMEHILDLLKDHGVTDIVATLYYLADEIVGYFGDGESFGVDIKYTVEDTPLGTAGSVKQAEDILSDGPFVIISGDALTDIDITAAYEFHKSRGAMATIILKRVPNPLEYGVVITDEEGRIQRFLEKPSWSEVFSDTVNTGIYILDPAIFSYMEPGKNYDFSQDIFPQILKEGKPLYGYIAEGYWCDVGNLDQYRQANYDVLSGLVNCKLEGTKLDAGIWLGEDCEIDPGAQIEGPTLIGSGARIKCGAYVGPCSVVGNNAIIESGTKVSRSVLWANNYVGSRSELEGCTVCNRGTIKSAVHIGEGAVVGDNCHIDHGATVRPGIKIWPDKAVESGSLVTMSLIWGSKWQGSLFRNLGISGIANVELTPEFATKLGACFGASLPMGSLVVTSRDTHPVSRMLKRAAIAGLMSVGAEVLDLRAMPTPIARYAIRSGGAAAGLHVRISPDSPEMSLIQIFDADGLNMSRKAERKLENLFFREDFRRTDLEHMGDLQFGSHAIETYSQAFHNALTAECPEQKPLKIVIDYAYSRLSSVFPAMLGKLKWDTVALNAYSDPARTPRTEEDKQELLRNLSRVVVTLEADVGVLIDADGEQLTIVDDTGRTIDGNTLLALFTKLAARASRGSVIAVPVTAPSALEELAAQSGAEILRTKTDIRDLMSAARQPGVTLAADTDGGFICPSFHPAYDAMYAFARLMTLATAEEQKLSALVSSLPSFWVTQESVRCPWEQKGKVMRMLAEEENSPDADFTDGIKIRKGNAWALVLPDSSEPFFRIITEGSDAEEAEELADWYVRRVTDLAA